MIMTPEELTDLQEAVKKAKRVATERAGELHDLVEERLPATLKEIPTMSQETYDACRAWAEAAARLNYAEAEATAWEYA